MQHKSMTPANRHAPWSWEFANAAARAAVSGLSASDVNKAALQQDDSSAWILVSHSPVVWAPMGSASGGGSGWTPTLRKADPTTPCLVKTGSSTLSVKAGTSVKVGASTIDFASQTSVAMPALTAGEDYSVWVRPDGTAVAVADPYTAPASPPVTGAVKIGGFHYGLVAPGTTVAGGSFDTTGSGMIWTQTDVDRIAGINAYSIWDLGFRPVSDPRGMTCVTDAMGRGVYWVDIYFCSTNHIANGTSRYNTDVASGTVLPRIPLIFGGNGSINYSRLSWYEANEIALSHNKRLPWYHELSSAAYGTTEFLSLGGAATTIPATARQPGFTSMRGVEQVTGHLWAWGLNVQGVGSATWVGGSQRGNSVLSMLAVILGGARNDSNNDGSRTTAWTEAPWSSGWHIGLRCAADHYQGAF